MLQLSDSEVSAFNHIKQILFQLSVIPHPRSDDTDYQLVTDSSHAVGAALHMIIDSKPVSVGFYSKKLSSAQQKYFTFDRELLAAYLATLHFKHQIEGRNVILLTDHKPLCNSFHSPNPPKSDRQQRHLSLLSEFIADVVYIMGDQNIVADCLSRPACAVQIDLCDLPQIANLQNDDEEIKMYVDRLKPV